jgi:hypothetical protein
MKVKYILLAIITATLFSSCGVDTQKANEPQLVEGVFGGGRLVMQVETNKSLYEYDEIIYVTATIANLSEEDIWILIPTSISGSHQELQCEITNGGSSLLNFDMHKVEFLMDDTKFLLAPGDKYVQVMRFSTRFFRGIRGNVIVSEEIPSAGDYSGVISAFIVQEQIVPFSVNFGITILEKSK